ncbi:hypothetical protein SUGI_0097670 [Cryptomeria japonica]|nr:hypothetical protein SUGI_0097670 [Cryptomeria japonica]
MDKNGAQKLTVMSKRCKRGDIKYKGVYQLSPNCYTAKILDPSTKKRVGLGTFATPESAAYAYDFAARELRGNRARTNFFYADDNSHSANFSKSNLSQLFKPNTPKLPGFNSNLAFTTSSNQPHLQFGSNASSPPFSPPSSISSSQNFSVPNSNGQNTKQEPSLTNFSPFFNKPSFLNATTTINAVPIGQSFPNLVESFCLQSFTEHRILDPFSQDSSSSLRSISGIEGKNAIDGIFSGSSLFDPAVKISMDPLSSNGEHEKKSSSSSVGLDSDISQQNNFLFLTDSIISSSGVSASNYDIRNSNSSSNLDCHFVVQHYIDSNDLLDSDNGDLKEMNYGCLDPNSQQHIQGHEQQQEMNYGCLDRCEGCEICQLIASYDSIPDSFLEEHLEP